MRAQASQPAATPVLFCGLSRDGSPHLHAHVARPGSAREWTWPLSLTPLLNQADVPDTGLQAPLTYCTAVLERSPASSGARVSSPLSLTPPVPHSTCPLLWEGR